MSDVKLPLSRRHLDIAIERLAPRFGESQRIRRAVANTIVAQLMPACVIKGGSSLKFRYGDIATRVTKDMDAAQGADLDAFISKLDEALHAVMGELWDDGYVAAKYDLPVKATVAELGMAMFLLDSMKTPSWSYLKARSPTNRVRSLS